ncbi:hypothetical protein GLX30_02080 [Streptomyces sp. Tu 2975]|nr:hypothetical protein [Streptomyces sp. Tu 2975]QIP83074.1 hypothetical protein GLX30_02080 [Streptomyces sp. Tu 2975]
MVAAVVTATSSLTGAVHPQLHEVPGGVSGLADAVPASLFRQRPLPRD